MRVTFTAELSATRAQPGSCSRKQISDHLSVCTGVDSSWAQRVPKLHQRLWLCLLGGRGWCCAGASPCSWWGVLCWCVPPRHGGACCVAAWPPSWWGVLCCCVAPLMVGRAVLVPVRRDGGVLGGGVWCGSVWLGLSMCVGLRLRLCCSPGRGWCCAGPCPPPVGACCVCAWPPPWWGVLRWCVPPPMVGRAALVCAPPHGGACCVGAWPPSWWGVLCWCLPAAVVMRGVVVFGLGCHCLLGCGCGCVVCPAGVGAVLVGRALFVRAPPLGGACCVGLFGFRFVVFQPAQCSVCFVGSLLSPPPYGRRCRLLAVCGVCLAGTNGPASRARMVRHPFVLAWSEGPASRARAVRHPVFLFGGCCRPATRVPLRALCCLVSALLLAVCWCLSPPAAASPPAHSPPNPALRLLSAAPPLLLAVAAPAGGCCSPPPAPGFRFAAVRVLLRVFPCSLCALSLMCAAWRFLGAPCCPPQPPGLCFAGFVALLLVVICSPAAFSWIPAGWPFVPPPITRFVFCGCCCPAACFSRVLLLLPCFFCAFGPGTCLVRFLLPPSARGLSCTLCVARWCHAPPLPGGCSWWCAVPRVLLCGAAAGCGLFCAARGVFLRRAVLACRCLAVWGGFVVGRLPLALAAPCLLVSRGALLHHATWCGVSSCVVPSCFVGCCGIFFGAVWCRGRGLVISLPSRFCAPAGWRRLLLPPIPPWCVCRALCQLVFPCCAGLFCALRCCACCLVLFGVRRAVSCCASRMVWCCAVLPRAAAP